MTISVTTKDQNTFEVVVTTNSTTTHSVTVSDAIHTKLTKKENLQRNSVGKVI